MFVDGVDKIPIVKTDDVVVLYGECSKSKITYFLSAQRVHSELHFTFISLTCTE